MANSVDHDQTAPSGAVGSGSTLFAYVILSDALVFEFFLGYLPYYNFAWYFRVVLCYMLSTLGPVVQSVVSLTSSLRVISLTVLADSIYNILIFFAEKM